MAEERKAVGKVMRNIQKLRANRISDDEIDRYVQSEGYTPEEILTAVTSQKRGQNRKQISKIADDVGRVLASGVTASMADEIAAYADTLVGGEIPDLAHLFTGEQESAYAQNLARQRGQDEQIHPAMRMAGEMVGGAASGAGLAGMALKGAKQTATSIVPRMMGVGAAEGAAFGAGSGEGAAQRMRGAATGATTGALLGGAGGGLQSAARSIPLSKTIADQGRRLLSRGRAAYRMADRAGVVLKSSAFNRMLKTTEGALAEKGFRPRAHPGAFALYKDLRDQLHRKHTLKGIEGMRSDIVAKIRSTADDRDRDMLGTLLDSYDDWMDTLAAHTDLEMGNLTQGMGALREARKLWKTGKKTFAIEEAISRAERGANKYSQSGLENSLRKEFRQLSKNRKKMRGYTAKEKALIEGIADGSLLTNIFQRGGKFAVRGPISGAVTGGAGLYAAGPMGALGVAAAAEASRAGATAGTVRAVERLIKEIQKGMVPKRGPRGIPLKDKQVLGGALGATGSTTPEQEELRKMFSP